MRACGEKQHGTDVGIGPESGSNSARGGDDGRGPPVSGYERRDVVLGQKRAGLQSAGSSGDREAEFRGFCRTSQSGLHNTAAEGKREKGKAFHIFVKGNQTRIQTQV
jgi:hypothetical protein